MLHTYTSKVLQSLVILTYILLIVFTPSVHFIPHIEFHDCQRILQLLLLSLVLLDTTFSAFNKSTSTLLSNKIKLGFYCLILLSIASAYQAIVPRYAVIEISIFVALYYLALFVARLYSANSVQLIKLLTLSFWVSIVLYMVSFYTGYITATVVGKTLVWPYPFYGFSNIRLFQQYQLWGLGIICLPLLGLDLKKNLRLWLYIGLTCWWVLLYYAASRGVMLSWIVAMLITAAVYKKLAWPFLRIQLINAATGLISYLILFKAIPEWITSTALHTANSTETVPAIVTSTIFRSTTFDRLDLWKAAYVMIKNFPILGVGPMHFYFYTPHGTHPHNSVIQIASEFGLPFTFIILSIIGYSFYCWMKIFNAMRIKTDSSQNKSLSIILFFTITANVAYSLVEGVIVMPISQVLMFTMIGLMIGQYNKNSLAKVNTESIVTKPLLGSIFAFIVLALMVLSIMPELVRGLTSQQRVLQSNERAFSMSPNKINPRIWMQQRRVESTKQ